ncbi:fimb protein [Allofranklinella schreckenbergeri]|uniref:fimb protein n=1 Tax=Allofranklinella schreckenbergeri TaxID=1076744 RepID=UPI0011C46290|nr:fimb protein [Allofranklinella schreckenbergeri]
MTKTNVQIRKKAVAIHLFLSLLILSILTATVIRIWYPAPYRELTGGYFLLMLIIGVDLLCGPFLTALVFNPKKSRRALITDLTTIIFIQLMALSYGTYSIFMARPVAEVFEVDRMVVVTAAQIDQSTLNQAPKNYQTLPTNGEIFLLSARAAQGAKEMLESTMMSVQGIEPSARADWWQEFSVVQPTIKQIMKPISKLIDRPGSNKKEILRAVEATGLPLQDAYYLPLVSFTKKSSHIRIFDNRANPVGYAKSDGFL